VTEILLPVVLHVSSNFSIHSSVTRYQGWHRDGSTSWNDNPGTPAKMSPCNDDALQRRLLATTTLCKDNPLQRRHVLLECPPETTNPCRDDSLQPTTTPCNEVPLHIHCCQCIKLHPSSTHKFSNNTVDFQGQPHSRQHIHPADAHRYPHTFHRSIP
jgi:hypothetical protein